MLKLLFILLIANSVLCLSQKELYEDCDTGSVKCFGGEDNCVGEKSCSFFVRVEKLKSGKFKFTTFDTTNRPDGYIGVALSFDKLMGGDSLVECVHGKSEGVFASFITEKEPKKPPTPTRLESKDDSTKISQQKLSCIDKVRYCEFIREPCTKVNGKSFDLYLGNLYLLLAMGKTENGKLTNHGEKSRYASSVPLKF